MALSGTSSSQSDHDDGIGCGDAILGIDGCIYWSPRSFRRTMEYDPHSDQTSLLGMTLEGRDRDGMVGRWRVMESSTLFHPVPIRSLSLTHWENLWRQ